MSVVVNTLLCIYYPDISFLISDCAILDILICLGL